jgi:hypothetical protein
MADFCSAPVAGFYSAVDTLMTIDEEGKILWSPRLSEEARLILKACGVDRVRIAKAHQAYLVRHRERFRNAANEPA